MFRFTIRDVIWLTVMVALACAWWLDRTGVKTRSDARTAAIQQAADDSAKSYQAKVLDWKFHAESLQSFIASHGGKAVFRTGQSGGEEVIVEQGTSSVAYYDPRQELERLKAAAAVRASSKRP